MEPFLIVLLILFAWLGGVGNQQWMDAHETGNREGERNTSIVMTGMLIIVAVLAAAVWKA